MLINNSKTSPNNRVDLVKLFMEFELSKDLTFFTDKMNNLQDELSNAKKPGQNPKCPNTSKRGTRNSLQKENTIEIEKATREPRKSGREPLKVLNSKKSVSPSTEKNSSHKRKSAAKSGLSQQKKEKISLPKIIVYEDSPARAKVQEKGNKRKSASVLSNFWDGSNATGRRNHSEYNKTPKAKSVSKTKNVRRSLNDLPSTKSPSKKEKSPSKKEKSPQKLAEEKKSPAVGKSRLTRLKPGQPEFEEMLTKLETLFPNVDPEFMKIQFIKFKSSLSEIIEFILTKEKTNELPTRADYLRRLEMERLHNKFMENFSVVNFLKVIPDPWEYFLKTEKHNCATYFDHSLHYLKTKYKKHYLRAIQDALAKNDCSLYLADKELKKKSRVQTMRITNRSKYECDAGRPTNFNIQFVHEVAFIENESKIKSHIKKHKMARYKKFKEAENAGTLLECQSCNDFSLLQDDVVNCPANHVFCKDCVVKYVEVEIEKDNFQFKCLLKCEEKFSLKTLQVVLSPSVMAKIIERNQLKENKSAGINDLVYCSLCYHVITMPSQLSVFKCLNPSCMMEFCRHCKKLSHVPLKCNELEKFDKAAVTEIEEQEDEGKEQNLPLKCSNCGGEFLKREDSNQMVCPCGATMCSLCRQQFRECQHFNAKPRNGSVHGFFFSSFDDDTETNDEIVDKDDVERNSNCSENFLEMVVSESENF